MISVRVSQSSSLYMFSDLGARYSDLGASSSYSLPMGAAAQIVTTCQLGLRSESKPGGIVAEMPRNDDAAPLPPASRNPSAGCKDWLARHAPRVSLPVLVGSPPKAFCSPAKLSVDFLQHRSSLIRLHLSLYVVKLQRHAEKRRGQAQREEQSCDPDRSARAIRGCLADVAGA